MNSKHPANLACLVWKSTILCFNYFSNKESLQTISPEETLKISKQIKEVWNKPFLLFKSSYFYLLISYVGVQGIPVIQNYMLIFSFQLNFAICFFRANQKLNWKEINMHLYVFEPEIKPFQQEFLEEALLEIPKP